jgi:hypothetical protein
MWKSTKIQSNQKKLEVGSGEDLGSEEEVFKSTQSAEKKNLALVLLILTTPTFTSKL